MKMLVCQQQATVLKRFFVCVILMMLNRSSYEQDAASSNINNSTTTNSTMTTRGVTNTEESVISAVIDGKCGKICIIGLSACGMAGVIVCLFLTIYFAVCKDKEKVQSKETKKWKEKAKQDKTRFQSPGSSAVHSTVSHLVSGYSVNTLQSSTTNKSLDSSDTCSSIGYFSDGYDGYKTDYYNPRYLNRASSLDYPDSVHSAETYSDYGYFEDSLSRYPSNPNVNKTILKSRAYPVHAHTGVFYDPNGTIETSPSVIPASMRRSGYSNTLNARNMYTIQETPDHAFLNVRNDAIPMKTIQAQECLNFAGTDQHCNHNSGALNPKRSVRFFNESYIEPADLQPSLPNDYSPVARCTTSESYSY